jgi:hypothetical protein
MEIIKMGNLEVINKRIRSLEALVTADSKEDQSPILKQLLSLREEIKTKAKIDYLDAQKNCLTGFRVLMENLTTLSYFAKEAGKDVRSIERAISNLNKEKKVIAEDIMSLKEDEEDENENESSEDKATASFETKLSLVVHNEEGAEYFTNYEEWCKAAEDYNIEKKEDYAIASDEDGTLGLFDFEEGEGCLFPSHESFSDVIDMESDDDEETDEETEYTEDWIHNK